MAYIEGIELLQELLDEKLGQEALVEDFIFKDTINMFYSEPGAGKSVIGINMLASMSRGLPVFGMFNTQKELKCLYMQLEGSRDEQLGRLQSIREVVNFNAMNIGWWDNSLNVESRESIKMARDVISKTKPEVIFIDSLYCLTGVGLSKEQGFLPVKLLIEELRKVNNSTFIIFHHCQKPQYHEGEKIEKDDPFLGSQYMKAFFDMTFFIKRKEKNQVVMEMKKELRNAEAIDKIVLDFDRANWVVLANQDLTSKPYRVQIINFLKSKFSKGKDTDTNEIVKTFGLTKRQLRRIKEGGHFENMVTFKEQDNKNKPLVWTELKMSNGTP